MRSWYQNAQIRAISESILNGLQTARVEAIRRNGLVRFQLVSELSDTCALTTAGKNWVISRDSVEGKCGHGPSEEDDPRIIQSASASFASNSLVLSADESTIAFNGLGRVTPAVAANIDFDISYPSAGKCAAAPDGGKLRCLRITVSPWGQVRMCDPKLDSDDPQGCP